VATRLEIKEWVRSQSMTEVDDLADVKLDALINEALRNIATRFRWPYLAAVTSLNLVAEQQAYTMPTDLQQIETITVTGARVRLEEVSPALAWQTFGDDFPTATEPYAFFIWGGEINLIPIPDTSEGSVIVHYYRAPVVLANDTESPEFASQFHMIVADYVLKAVWEREEDFVKAESHMAAFRQGIEQMARFYLNRAGDNPTVLGDGSRIAGRLYPNMPWFQV
jgi:hypothetical protein